MKTMRLFLTLGVLALGACAAPSQHLLDARAAYARAAAGPVRLTTPAELRDAERALRAAEQELADRGNTELAHDLAYIAMRKVQLAEARTQALLDQQRALSLLQQAQTLRDARTSALASELRSAREQLVAEQGALAQAERELELSRQAQRRPAPPPPPALVRSPQDEVTVISSEVLFVPGQRALSGQAKQQLDALAQRLLDDLTPTVTIEGYSDDTGASERDTKRSLDSADAVRDYLLSRGVSPERVQSWGMGAQRPLYSNDTAEHRAKNRRVEIVIHTPAPVS